MHIYTHTYHGISLYGATTVANLSKILILQKKAIRIILHLKHDESVREHFKDLKILTVFGQYIYETVCLTKAEISKKPTIDTHNYEIMYKSQIVPKKHRLDFFEKKPTYIGNTFLNKLSADIKNEEDLETFKHKVKYYLSDQVYYSFEVFMNI